MPDTWKLAGCEGMEVLFFFCMAKDNKDIQVVIASGLHLYPFRTEKLNLTTPMVLRNSGRVGSCRIIKKKGGEREGRKVSFSSFLLFFVPCRPRRHPLLPFPSSLRTFRALLFHLLLPCLARESGRHFLYCGNRFLPRRE